MLEVSIVINFGGTAKKIIYGIYFQHESIGYHFMSKKAVLIIAKRLPVNTINYNKIAVEQLTARPEILDYYPQSSSKPLYNYSYNTDSDIQAQEDGYLNHINTEQETLGARGSYSYTDAEGNTFQVSYVVNENEFQPEGAHLAVAPLIKKALQYIAQHPEENEEQ